MGRTVVGDDNQLDAQVDSIFRTGCSVQVGLLIGKSGTGGARDLVFALVRTPQKDGEDAATLDSRVSKGQSQESSSKARKANAGADSAPMNVSIDWVAEHARQSVMAVAASAIASSPSLDGGEVAECLLLHISSSPRRISCRSCVKGASFSALALRPCVWKLGKLLTNLQAFSCTYTVDISYPVQIDEHEQSSKGLRQYLSSAITFEEARLQSAHAVLDGSLVEPNKLLASGSTLHAVELLLPFGRSAHVQSAGDGGKIVGQVVCKGEIQAMAYGVVREPLSRAIADLKGDIVASLRARLELLVDEAEQAADDAELGNDNQKRSSIDESRSEMLPMDHISNETREHSCIMPRRVFVPWLRGARIADYMLCNETFEDVQERAIELFSVDQKLEPSAIIEPELIGCIPAKVVIGTEIRDKDAGQTVSENLTVVEAETGVSSPIGPPFLGVALVLILALLLSIIALVLF